MSILKIKNCLVAAVLLGATSGYSMYIAPDEADSFQPQSHSLGAKIKYKPALELRDDCGRDHHRRGSFSSSSDSDSEDEGGKLMRLINHNKNGVAVVAESRAHVLLASAALSSESMLQVSREAHRIQVLTAQIVDSQTRGLKAVANALSMNLNLNISTYDARRFAGSCHDQAMETRETVDILRHAAAVDLKMAEAEVGMAIAEEAEANFLERNASVLQCADAGALGGKKKKRNRKKC